MTAVMGWPSPTRRGVRHTSRIPAAAARAEIYGLSLGVESGGFNLNWSPVGTGGWSSPAHIQAIISLVSNPLETRSDDERLVLRDQITFTRHYLSLSVADFARLVGVERPAIYAWMDGSNEPRPANHESLNRLYRAGLQVKERLGEPAGSLLRVTTREVERSLYDLLASAAESAELSIAIDTLATLPRRLTSTRALPERSDESISRGHMRALSMTGRRLK